MSEGENLVIHTNSSYGPELSASLKSGNYNLDALYQSAYDYLRNAELSFYHQFFSDVNDIDTFLSKVRDIFSKATGVKEYLERFTNKNLSQFLPGKDLSLFERGYRIEITGDMKPIIQGFKTDTVEVNGTLYLKVNPQNVQVIRALLNNKLKYTGNSRFEDNDKITRNLINTLSTQGERLFNIDFSTSPQSPSTKTFDIHNVTKQKYNKDNIDKLLKSNAPEDKQKLEKLRMDMRKSLNEMKQFLLSGIPADNDLQKAVEETWNSVLPVGEDMLLRNFFFEGKNYQKALLGQPGEFYNKVILLYLSKKVNNPIGINIIGSLLKGGQQPHSDLQIMVGLNADIGFQTKNVNVHNKKNIKANTNADLIRNNFGDNMISVLVNYFTNTDYAPSHSDVLDSIKDVLEDRFFQAMNLNIAPELDSMQTNTFYFVSGENIVPCSEIIKEIQLGAAERPQFEISGKVSPSLSNQGYKDNFTEYFYWKYPKGENSNPSSMIPTDKNNPAFNRAAQNISIQTSFSLTALIDSGRFEIFY